MATIYQAIDLKNRNIHHQSEIPPSRRKQKEPEGIRRAREARVAKGAIEAIRARDIQRVSRRRAQSRLGGNDLDLEGSVKARKRLRLPPDQDAALRVAQTLDTFGDYETRHLERWQRPV